MHGTYIEPNCIVDDMCVFPPIKGLAARCILMKLENWLMFNEIPKFLLSFDKQSVSEAITFIEDLIDDIDDHNQNANPCKDIVTVSKERYDESFPKLAFVFDKNFALLTNPEFDQIMSLLNKRSSKNPLVITSARKSTVSDQLQFGNQYIVDGCANGVRIHYEHEGNGDILIPKIIIENLFTIRNLLQKRSSELRQELCLR